MKNLTLFLIGVVMLGTLGLQSAAHANTSSSTLAASLAGRIVLQVEANGEAYYIDPVDLKRYFLGRPSDAFFLMTAKGLGIRHTELQTYLSATFPSRLSGRILLDVERAGQAYYVDPVTLHATYLGNASAAFALMEDKGLGITNANLALIHEGTLDVSMLARATFNKVNEYRVAHGKAALAWNADIAAEAAAHSRAMASGSVSFGHDGFDDRIADLHATLTFGAAAENVATNDSDNMVKTAVDGWLSSSAHLANITNASFDTTGVGVAADGDTYFFTQIFVDAH